MKKGVWKKVGRGLKIAGKVGAAVATGGAAPEIIEAVSAAAGAGAQVVMPEDPMYDAMVRIAAAVINLALLLMRRPQDDAKEA